MKPLELLNDDNNYRQETSALSYYIFKNFLFNENSIDIIMSRDIKNINTLISKFSNYIKKFNFNPNIPHNSLSMRMTLYELK